MRAPSRQAESRGRWWRFALMLVITVFTLLPIVSIVTAAFGLGGRAGGPGAGGGWPFLQNFVAIFQYGPAMTWFGNSLAVAAATVLVSVAVGAPAGYVLSRARHRLVAGYALAIFVAQSLPVILFVIPLFILFAKLGLVDSLVGIGIIYVGTTVSVAVWMFAAYFDSIPESLEEAAWIDGCSVAGGFARIVLRNSLPGVLSTAIFSFLVAWNEYLIALVFLRSDANYTLALGLEASGHSPALAVVMMLPPLLIFAFLHRYFSVGGIGGALAGT